MNIVHNLAGGDALKYEQVLEMPVVYAYLNRRIKLQEYVFNKKLSEILKKPKAA